MEKNIKSNIAWRYGTDEGVYFDDFGFLFEDENGINDYWWEEGNGACDCNRSTYFGLAEKYPEKCRERDDAFPCGNTIEILNIEPLKTNPTEMI